MVKRVLLATDGSPSSLAAARWVGELASQVQGLEVTILHVYLIPEVYATGGVDAAVVPDVLPELPPAAERRRVVRPILDAARRAVGDAPAQIRTRVAPFHDPAAAIVGLARAGGFDMIVVGHRGMSVVARLVIESVSDRVVQQARCPVVVVRAAEQADARGEAERTAARRQGRVETTGRRTARV